MHSSSSLDKDGKLQELSTDGESSDNKQWCEILFRGRKQGTPYFSDLKITGIRTSSLLSGKRKKNYNEFSFQLSAPHHYASIMEPWIVFSWGNTRLATEHTTTFLYSYAHTVFQSPQTHEMLTLPQMKFFYEWCYSGVACFLLFCFLTNREKIE